jgi:hypothetical protein
VTEIVTGLRAIGARCRLGRNVVRRMIAEGALPATYTSGRYRIAASMIAPFLAALAVSERSPHAAAQRAPRGGGVVRAPRPLAGYPPRRKKGRGKACSETEVPAAGAGSPGAEESCDRPQQTRVNAEPPQAGEAGRTSPAAVNLGDMPVGWAPLEPGPQVVIVSPGSMRGET